MISFEVDWWISIYRLNYFNLSSLGTDTELILFEKSILIGYRFPKIDV